jgi:PAS domain S-box-containing protein
MKTTQEVARLLTDFAGFVSQGIAFVDLNGIICFANTAWVKMHGYAPSEHITGKNISIFYAQHQPVPGVPFVIEETRHKGYFEGSLEHVRLDGSPFQAQVRIIILRAAGKEVGYAVFATDLPESNHFEQLLAELRMENQQLHNRVTQLCKSEQSLTQEISKIKDEKDESINKIYNCDVDEKQSGNPSAREKPLFDPEKLKSLADLAKRLAEKRNFACR